MIMNTAISFCIVTTEGTSEFLEKVIDSIRNLKIPQYEVIVVGGAPIKANDVVHIPFDETVKPGWITRKKNLANSLARYPNVIHQHDYFAYDEGFYEGFIKFNEEHDDFDICMARILNIDGTRYRDWCAWNDPRHGYPWLMTEPWALPNGIMMAGKPFLASYDYKLTQFMYISGGWLMARKCVMDQVPWNEDILWGQGEDLYHSMQTLQQTHTKYKYIMNKNSIVRLLKYKDPVFPILENLL